MLDLAEQCSVSQIVINRDITSVIERTKNEGLSFMTITLPNFLEGVMNALERGYVISSDFSGWRKRKCLPVFLQGFTRIVFNIDNGSLLEKPSIDGIFSLRQICSLFKKIKINCTKERYEKAIRDFRSVDSSIVDVLETIPDNLLSDYNSIASILCTTLFHDYDTEKLVPHHGPGFTADHLFGNQKYDHNRLHYEELLSFPKGLNFWNSEESYNNDDIDIAFNVTGNARLCAVPKTLKAPRIIALEPASRQFLQQGIKDYLYDHIENNTFLNKSINFQDQSINRSLALENSVTRYQSTIDLSAASDRINKQLIYLMLSSVPKLRDDVFSTRSDVIEIDGEPVKLNKFASMGSALCFPLESLHFFILCAVVIKGSRRTLTHMEAIKLATICVKVYGDDIIIPSTFTERLYETFPIFGSKVNMSKSFVKSKFRESCGCDAYDGVDITPLYARQIIPNKRTCSNQIVSYVSLTNQLFNKCLFRTSSYIKEHIEKLVGILPYVTETCSGLGWTFGSVFDNLSNKAISTRYHKGIQALQVRTLVPEPIFFRDEIDGYPALLKCLLNLTIKNSKVSINVSTSPLKAGESVNKQHLKKTVRRGSLALKYRWVSF